MKMLRKLLYKLHRNVSINAHRKYFFVHIETKMWISGANISSWFRDWLKQHLLNLYVWAARKRRSKYVDDLQLWYKTSQHKFDIFVYCSPSSTIILFYFSLLLVIPFYLHMFWNLLCCLCLLILLNPFFKQGRI